ncbi:MULTISPECIES: LysM peptidoglycan-binding domain-containing protein [unclassified Marinitoga]|uniref:LysM peptidoglycan-binding domain-containing protein n=1 Tax=unclassified Marinitoga TaxID=2640159 RepID=UPI00158668AD|nr:MULTISPECIES: LysM peptidoglycan-binding domain-containing protein [unclassified Marinitoga]
MKRLSYIVLLIILVQFFSSCSLLQGVASDNERLNDLETEVSTLKLKLTNYESELNYYKETVETYNSRIEDLNRNITNLGAKIKKIEDTLSASNAEIANELNKYKSELILYQNTLNNLQKKIGDIQNIDNEGVYSSLLSDINQRITNIENNIKILNNEAVRISDLNTLKNEFITRDSTELQQKFEALNIKITNEEKRIDDLKREIHTTSSSITNIEVSLKNMQNKGLILEGKINNIEKTLAGITLSSTEIKNNIDVAVKNNIDELLKTVNSLDKVWQINFETLEKDFDNLKNDYNSFKGKVGAIIDEENLKKYVYESVSAETQREVAKLFYKTKSDELLKIKGLENQMAQLEKNIKNLENSFEMITSRPISTFDEKYKTQLDELERKLTNALISFSKAEIKDLFGSTDQIIYQVKPGDTLSQIALAFGLGYNGVDLIKVANNIDDPRSIRVGQKIIIPVNNIEEFLTWPLTYTKPSDYDRIVVRFGDRISTGVSVGLGILPLKDEYVRPTLPGRVVEIGKAVNESKYVKIDHGNGVMTVYSNIYNIDPSIKEGKWVDTETLMGKVKKDKLFNFEIWKNGEPRDPMKLFFKFAGNFRATFYTEWDDKIIYYPAFRLTKSGNVPRPWVTVAADPKYLPLGTVVYIPEFRNTPNMGFFEVEDIGSKIVGNRLDIYINDVRLAQNTQEVSVYVVGKKARR